MPPTSRDEVLAAKFAVLLPQLDERQRRLLLGAEARALGRGGIARVAAAAGVSAPTVTRGLAEVRVGATGDGRVRKPGGGRKPLTQTDPGLLWFASELAIEIGVSIRQHPRVPPALSGGSAHVRF